MTPEGEKKLADALAKDVEYHGGDPTLALQVAEMTEEQKQQSRRNADASVARLRRLAAETRKRDTRDV